MTSRERLLKALAIEEPDRVPISTYEMVGWNPDTFYNQQPSYKALMDLVREKTDCVYMAPIPYPSLGNPADRVDRDDAPDAGEGVTVKKWREGPSQFTHVTYRTSQGDLTSLQRRDDAIDTVWMLEHPLKSIDDIDTYLAIPWSLGDMDMSAFAAKQRELGQRGVMMPSLSDPICTAAEAFEMGQFLVYALTDTDRMVHLMDAVHERQMAHLHAVMKAGVEAGVDWSEVHFRICGPEYATPPYLGPEHFAKFVTPYVKRMSDVIHQYGAKMRLHSHGKIGRVLDEIMKTDPDALDPIEPPPDGDIELAEVNRRIGDRVCLFGNLELKLLEHGSRDEVRNAVIAAMNDAKAGGGFVIMTTASPINTPLSSKTEANYFTFIETALQHGRY